MQDAMPEDSPGPEAGQAPPSLSDGIYRQLRMALISGAYRPGERINISRLAERFGTSVTPVREAIFQLVRENALEFRAGHQPRVPVLDVDHYIMIRETRVPVERLAARLAAPRLTVEALLRLEELHRDFVAQERAQNWHGALAANRAFHFMIYNESDNPTLVRVIENLWLIAGPTAAQQYPSFLNAQSEPHHHMLFIAAVREGAFDDAAEELVNDLREGSFRIVSYLKRRNGAEG